MAETDWQGKTVDPKDEERNASPGYHFEDADGCTVRSAEWGWRPHTYGTWVRTGGTEHGCRELMTRAYLGWFGPAARCRIVFETLNQPTLEDWEHEEETA